MKRKNSFIFLFFLIGTFVGKTQNLKDSSYAIPIVGLHFSGQMALGDLYTRFGNSGSAGLPFIYKTKNNFIIGGEFTYFFGKTVKEQGLLSNMKNAEGTITANDGAPGRLRINERGWNLFAFTGAIVPVWNNKNCGPIVWLGAGYMQHKVNLYDVGKNLPQLRGNLRKGYDRLTGGIAFTQFVGYLYLSNNRLTNFYAGFEFNEGFTNGLRGVQYDTMMSDNKPRKDIQIGFRVGWALPLYKRVKEFYYN